MNALQQYCTFYLDQHFFGIEVRRIQEIIKFQQMTHVPLAPKIIRGLINLRGQIVTAMDLRRRLALPEYTADHKPTNIVVRAETGIVSLIVDEIGDVIDLDEQQRERPPETLRGPAREVIRYAYKMEDCLLLILDVDQVAAIPAGGPGAEN